MRHGWCAASLRSEFSVRKTRRQWRPRGWRNEMAEQAPRMSWPSLPRDLSRGLLCKIVDSHWGHLETSFCARGSLCTCARVCQRFVNLPGEIMSASLSLPLPARALGEEKCEYVLTTSLVVVTWKKSKNTVCRTIQQSDGSQKSASKTTCPCLRTKASATFQVFTCCRRYRSGDMAACGSHGTHAHTRRRQHHRNRLDGA